MPVAVLALVGCQPAGETGAMSEAADLTPIISARTSAFAEAINAMNTDSVMTFYATDATVMPPNVAPLHGTEAIRSYMGQPPIPGATARLDLITEDVNSAGSIAVERGRYVWTMTPDEGTEGMAAQADSGSYLAQWQEVNGTWVMVDDIWVSRLPAMPQPASDSAAM